MASYPRRDCVLYCTPPHFEAADGKVTVWEPPREKVNQLSAKLSEALIVPCIQKTTGSLASGFVLAGAEMFRFKQSNSSSGTTGEVDVSTSGMRSRWPTSTYT